MPLHDHEDRRQARVAAPAPAAGNRYRGRYAPSPTGPLHFGSVVAAVASYADARAHGGEWLVRIDDIDRPRVVPDAADAILRTLDALGMRWDGTVIYQSARLEAYHAALHQLRARGRVYACSCSRREIADSSIRGVEGYVYPGTCRSELGRRARAWRYDTRGLCASFEDAIQGAVAQDVEREVGDFVLYRADGVYAYHLAASVDDAEQGVTHIVRGADLLVSTPRQILLQQALDLPRPAYAHVPVAVNAHGEKLSKQTQAPAVAAADGRAALLGALAFLGQPLPPAPDAMDCTALWDWIIPRWRLDAVPRIRTRCIDLD